eukprot:TRINITY_DN3484_c0_g1_i1.p1 TRINITY_DN3484_c0_g1~~TRINITY_DN3484_c0_g1_i1.p1  ORF type:complete len:661 (+),score=106.63 TRINITY_DN3484_c0_g1_i1:60-2042(+)
MKHMVSILLMWIMAILAADSLVELSASQTTFGWNERQMTIDDMVISPTIVKRQSFPPTPMNPFEGEPCSKVGKEKFGWQEKDVCEGLTCHPLEASCSDGTILHFSPHVNHTITPAYNRSIISNCFITRLRCYVADQAGGVFFNLKDQFNSTECRAESVLCQGQGGSPQEIFGSSVTNNQLARDDNCHVQVLCSNWKRYGFDAFGWRCVQDQIQCGSRIVDIKSLNANNSDAFFNNTLPGCQITQRPCGDLESYYTCRKYEIFCAGKEVNGCQTQHLPINCNSSPSVLYLRNPNCAPTLLRCQGVIINASDYINTTHGSLNACDLLQMKCNSGIQRNFENCSIESLACIDPIAKSTLPVDSREISGNLTERSCLIDKMKCQNEDGCSLVQPVCTGMSTCALNRYSFPCRYPSVCQQSVNSSSCICPIDRWGDHCEKNQSLSCNVSRVEPSQCNVPVPTDVPRKWLSSDWPCLEYSMKSSVQLGFKLKCQFRNDSIIITNETLQANFTYAYQGDGWAISGDEKFGIRTKLINFFRMSEDSQVEIQDVTKDQVEGREIIWYNRTMLSEIPDRFWAGNRLYLEMTWDGEGPPSDDRRDHNLGRIYIDATDRPVPTVASAVKVRWNVIIIVAIVVVSCLSLVLFVVYKCYMLRRPTYQKVPQNET